jgi:hypothetical protein
MHQITDDELQEKIRAWRREYGGGGSAYVAGMSNILQTLIDHKGFVPRAQGKRGIALGTIADEFEQALRDMAATPAEPGRPNQCFRMAMAFRCYYQSSIDDADEDMIDRMRDIGLPMSRSTFYRSVRQARAFLLGWYNGLRAEIRERNGKVA